MTDIESAFELLLGSGVPEAVTKLLGEDKIPLDEEITLGKANVVNMYTISQLMATLIRVVKYKKDLAKVLGVDEETIDKLFPTLKEMETMKIVEIWLSMKFLRNKDGFERLAEIGLINKGEEENIEEDIEESKRSAIARI